MTPLLLFLLACAAIYLGTISAAFNSLMRLSVRIEAESTDRDTLLGRYLDDPQRLFIPVRILTTAVLMVATALVARLTGVERLGLPTLIAAAVALGLVCEHLVPLAIVRRDPERVLEVLLPSFDVLARLLRPLTLALLHLGSAARRLDRVGTPEEPAPARQPVPAAPEADAAVREGREARELLRTLVDFRETMVREVMTPRPDIVAIEAGATLDELMGVFREQQYSRIPVYKETLDNVVGFVFVKDLIQLKNGTAPVASITALMRPAYFVPETKRVPELLKEFQRKRLQIAIVVDEYGGTAGLVTVEDLLEEIVGEIRDEYDLVEVEPVVEEGAGRFVFSGNTHVDELASHLKVDIEAQGFETVGGFLLSRLGRVPVVGERFEVDGLDVEVLEAERRRIVRVRMQRHEAPQLETGTAAS
jgi:CBS domain containing-hemolysin-like protein